MFPNIQILLIRYVCVSVTYNTFIRTAINRILAESDFKNCI